jgi:hypothetical protein
MMQAWSYSSITQFEKCPKQYNHLRVLKDVKQEDTEALIYGNEVHAAAEQFISKNVPIPPKYNVIEPIVTILKQKPGRKYTELKLGIKLDKNSNPIPCEFFDKYVWLRTVLDLLIVNNDEAYLVDYKTGKNARYHDTRQLDLMAAAAFVHYPKLKVIRSGLAYVVSDEFIKKTHKVEQLDDYIGVFDEQLYNLNNAYTSGQWSAKPSGLCGWCPVASCEHHKG